jgi:uncharacterized membrane protein YozB (DUF420 family)
VPSDNFKLMLVFTDVLFIASVLLVIVLINTELKKNKDNHRTITFYPRTTPWILSSIISAVIILTFAHYDTKSMEPSSQVNEGQHQHH